MQSTAAAVGYLGQVRQILYAVTMMNAINDMAASR